MKLILLMSLILGINFCPAQSETEKKLIGKWLLVEQMDSFNDEIEKLSINESSYNSKNKTEVEKQTTLVFKNDNSIFINQIGDEYSSTFKLVDSILSIGNRKYVLVEIDNKKLIFKDKDGLFNKHYKYKKIN